MFVFIFVDVLEEIKDSCYGFFLRRFFGFLNVYIVGIKCCCWRRDEEEKEFRGLGVRVERVLYGNIDILFLV